MDELKCKCPGPASGCGEPCKDPGVAPDMESLAAFQEAMAGSEGATLPPFLAEVQDLAGQMLAQLGLTPKAQGWRDMLDTRQRAMLDLAIQIDQNYKAAGWPGQGQASLIATLASILDSLV